MTELSPDAENLIAQANGGDEPSAFDEKRVRTRIAARLAVAAIATSTVSTTPAQALSASSATTEAVIGGTSAASAGSISATLKTVTAVKTGAAGAMGATGTMGSALSKLLLAFALGGGSAALGTQYLIDEPTRDARVQESTASEKHFTEGLAAPDYAPESEIETGKEEPSSVALGTQREPNRDPSAATPAAPTPAAPTPAAPTPAPEAAKIPALPRKTASALAASPSYSAPSAPSAPSYSAPGEEASLSVPSAVREEASLLRRARSALASGGAAEAQRLLRRHKELFPQGALVEERTATQIMAECAQGRTVRTDRRAAEFLNAYPRSPLASSVRQACSQSEQRNDSLTDLPPLGH